MTFDEIDRDRERKSRNGRSHEDMLDCSLGLEHTQREKEDVVKC